MRRSTSDQPFVLWASFPDPHHPFDCPVPWSLLHDPAEVDLPEHRTLDLDRRPWWHRASLEGKPKIREDLAKIREEYSRVRQLSDVELREIIANTYGMLALIDHNVGRIMAELHRLGIADDTLVVYASDHGDWLGDHGLLLKGPMAYEGLMRVPLVMRGPGVPAGQVIDDPVSTLDLGATFLDTAGVERPANWHSRSLLPVLEGEEHRDFALNEWDLNASRCGVELKLRTVRTRTHRLTQEVVSGAGELYDLVADPHEMDNRFDDPAIADIRQKLEAMIASRPDDALDPPLSRSAWLDATGQSGRNAAADQEVRDHAVHPPSGTRHRRRPRGQRVPAEAGAGAGLAGPADHRRHGGSSRRCHRSRHARRSPS